jgi:hypothetical protein
MTVTSPELVRLVQEDRERHIRQDQLARLAARVKACCRASLVGRIARTLRHARTAS